MTAASVEPTVYVVDDDDAIRDALDWLFQSRGFRVSAFDSAESFLAAYRPGGPGCLVADIRMSGMSGLELQEHLRCNGDGLPVILLTGHGDVGMAVGALKKGAADFVEKPFSDNELADRVAECLARDGERWARAAAREGVEQRLMTLTSREYQVMRLMLAGRLNKVIADELQISMRTVEVHRSRALEKMGVRSVLELSQQLGAHGIALSEAGDDTEGNDA